jgi:dCTP deaminase
MIASGQTIREMVGIIEPFCERTKFKGMTYGIGPAGYDVRIDQKVSLAPGGFTLASTVERFQMPNYLVGLVKDKSTWARLGICVQNTVIEPGWSGYLTLELTNHSAIPITIEQGSPIAQILFQFTDKVVDRPYAGKYSDQKRGPQEAIIETEV